MLFKFFAVIDYSSFTRVSNTELTIAFYLVLKSADLKNEQPAGNFGYKMLRWSRNPTKYLI